MKTHNSVALEVDDLHRTYYDEKVRLQAPCLTVEQMEARVKSTINGLREIRGTMTIMAQQHDDYSYELAEMVIVARKATQEAMFKVRRYHDVKEEAIRVKHRRELAALGQERNGLLTYCAKRMTLVVRHNVESRVANNASCCDKKLEQLQDALDKVEMHEFLLSSDVGDSCW